MKSKLRGFVDDGFLVGISCQRLSGMEGVCVVLEELYKRGGFIRFFGKLGKKETREVHFVG